MRASHPQHRIPLYGLFAFAALLCVVLESVPCFDRFFQDYFFQDGAWLLTKQFHLRYRTALYVAPKIFIGIICGVFLGIFVAASKLSATTDKLAAWKKPSLIVVLSIALAPLAVAAIKAVSGVYGPIDLVPYGGKHPHNGLLQQLMAYGHTAGGRSFPAGHASGGFAFVSLYYLPLSSFSKKLMLASGLGFGWGMGLYQIARGEHFLSHTLAAMFIALAVASYIAQKTRVFQL